MREAERSRALCVTHPQPGLLVAACAGGTVANASTLVTLVRSQMCAPCIEAVKPSVHDGVTPKQLRQQTQNNAAACMAELGVAAAATRCGGLHSQLTCQQHQQNAANTHHCAAAGPVTMKHTSCPRTSRRAKQRTNPCMLATMRRRAAAAAPAAVVACPSRPWPSAASAARDAAAPPHSQGARLRAMRSPTGSSSWGGTKACPVIFSYRYTYRRDSSSTSSRGASGSTWA